MWHLARLLMLKCILFPILPFHVHSADPRTSLEMHTLKRWVQILSKSELWYGRQGAGDLELRHQRTADVIVGPAAAGAAIPEGVYAMIETLLTEAGLWESTGRCRLLELTWHGQKSRQGRPGWVTVVQET